MNLETFLTDIPLSAGRDAHYGASFEPDKRAAQEQNNYAQTLAADYAHFQKVIADKPEMAETLAAEFERYRQGYRAHYLKHLQSRSRIVSTMIAGPANFPVQRMEKRNRVAHKRLEELLDFRKRAISAITKTLCPELRPIMAGDSDAVDRLQEKIAEAEKQQERMVLGNKIVRKFIKDHEAGRLALEQAGFSAGEAKSMFEPDCFGGLGFASFELTNNNANIRRMQARLAQIKVTKAAVGFEAQGSNARIEDCPQENRVRLFFSGKPSEEIRSRLKSNGFRWTPSVGCWQAYRNQRTYDFAKREAGCTEETLREAVLSARSLQAA